MRGVSSWVSRVAPLFAVLLVFGAVGAWAEDALPPMDPQARISPPDGVSAQARLNPPVGIAPPDEVTTQARIEPPVGVTTQARINPPGGLTAQARLQPPGGAPDQMSLMDMILGWLQSRIRIPNR